MVIVDAEVYGAIRMRQDVRLENGVVTDLGSIAPRPGERVLDARGGALLPGLHDHHLHLLSYAASLGSVPCGPPRVTDADALNSALTRAAGRPGTWIRGIGYHENVAGDIDRAWLDRHGPARPVRIQHRSGRLWIVNSLALEIIGANGGPAPADGRVFDGDAAIRTALGAVLPPVTEASRQLARFGVTGVTDMTPTNGLEELTLFEALRREGYLLQPVRVAGSAALSGAAPAPGVAVGETKFHLHETALPDLDDFCAGIRKSHHHGRAVAVHCVTEAELVFSLAALRMAGPIPGDRIEHASVTPPALLGQLCELSLKVVTQPNFVSERGTAYLHDIPAAEHGWLYRCRSFVEAGVPLAGGTDAPFGHADPWRAIRAAVHRQTADTTVLGDIERLTPEQALDLFLGAADAPELPRQIRPGTAADLCLLTVPWERAREVLASALVRATVIQGEIAHEHPH